ncbi:MAG: hypothetical protein WA364_19010 [Candidatus Nitrosopolaris sp.]
MYSIKQEHNSKNHKKISNNIMIKYFSVNLVVVTLVTTLMLMPLHIFASERAWVAQWNGNHHLTWLTIQASFAYGFETVTI